ncbi:hypothetical protein B0T21DRAFT_389836 [Apiosordaria backusii]|uniref:Uncharacterized protein n=1 Tax=Apiosordaria backusii TaxID=314023 RepID=A0AA40ES56_9PEZI|nr:hypothetical protein B0T21DRAFT_389836 [Apiosordaria backusii]
MRDVQTLALAAIASSLFLSPALSLPQAGSIPDAAPLPWVTVDPLGNAETLTPKVITTEGHRATLSNPPAHLLSTATYTLTPDGRLSTYTGLAPVATAASNSNDAGVFLACQADKGHDEPFCLPRRGSSLVVGRTYYITWSPSYFSPQSTPLTVHILFSPSGSSEQQPPLGQGTNLTPIPLPASEGFFPWTIPPNYLSGLPGSPSSVIVSLSLQHNDTTTTTDELHDITTVSGPTVTIISSLLPSEDADSGGNGTNILAIVLPIVIIIALLVALGGFCFLSWRRKGKWPVIGGLVGRGRRRSGGGGGYHAGQGGRRAVQDQGAATGGVRVAGDNNKSETNVGVELTDRDSWSPSSPTGRGRNVFREEVERQERLARGVR